MALGRAFIEVHADLRPFKRQLRNDVKDLLKDVQQTIDETLKEKFSGGGRGRGRKLRPDIDTTDVDRKLGDSTDKARRKLKEALEDGSRDGRNAFEKIWDSPGKTFDQLTLLLIAAVVAALPYIGAGLAGAVVGAAGLGGIVGGVLIAFQDPRIKTAAGDLGDTIMEGLRTAGAVFLEPTMKAIELLESAFNRALPNIQRIFENLAPYVSRLAIAIGDFFNILVAGLADADLGPFIDVLAQGLPEIGAALAYMFVELSKSEGALAGFRWLLMFTADAIEFITDMLWVLSEMFLTFFKMLDTVPDVLLPDSWEQGIDEILAASELVPESADKATQSLLRIGEGAESASNSAKDLTASLNQFFGAQLGWVDANIRFEDSIDKVAEAFKGSTDSININTATGRQNVTAVNDSIKAAIAARDAKIKETGSVAAANAIYLQHIDRLRGTLREGGLTEKQIRKLIGAYENIPHEVDTTLKVQGLSAALSQAQALARTLSSIRSQNIRLRQAASGDGIGGMADGGIVTREQLTWIGEGNRPEAVIPLTNPGRAAEVMAEAGLLGMGGGTITVQLILDGKVIDERIVKTNQASARRIQQQPRVMI